MFSNRVIDYMKNPQLLHWEKSQLLNWKIYSDYISKSTMQKPVAILDANALISGQDLVELGRTHSLVTTQRVLNEIRDQHTRNMLDNFPHEIRKMVCTKQSIKAVQDFAKKTGDINSLSDVDMDLLAVAYQMYIENGQADKIRSAPPAMKEMVVQEDCVEECSSSGDEDSTGKQTLLVDDTDKERQGKSKEEGGDDKDRDDKQGDKDHNKDKDEDKDEDEWIMIPKSKPKRKQSQNDMDEEEGWITPQNYQKQMAQINTCYVETDRQQQPNMFSLMTADYSMQNVALQMGIALLSLDGRRINSLRRFIHECYVCWKQYKIEDNKVHLCKQCGYNSLSKVAYSMGANGETVLHRKKGWKPNQQVLQWKERKLEEQQKRKKNQHGRRKKQVSIFDTA